MKQKILEIENKIKELREELESFKKSLKINVPELGDVVDIAGFEWIILDKTDKGYLALSSNQICSSEFGSNNDWKESKIRKFLNEEFYEQFQKDLGDDAIIPIERNLLSLDGQDEYGTCIDKVSLISVDEYRKYRKHIPNTEEYWWWTITPDSTQCNKDSKWISVVSPSGYVDCINLDSRSGVRPVCIFSFSIFESGE